MEEIRRKSARRVTLHCLLMVLIAAFLGTTVSEAAEVVLAWDPSPDPAIIGYNIYRSESLGTFSVSALNGSLVYGTTFTDTTGDWSRTYYYVVTAVSAQGVESAPTDAVQSVPWLPVFSSESEAVSEEYSGTSNSTSSAGSGSASVTSGPTFGGAVTNWVGGDGVRWFQVNGATYQWGYDSDVPVSGDFDGDGQPDIAVFRPWDGNWWILTSSSGFYSYLTYQWGTSGDIPVTGDYDSDGRTDIAIFRPWDGNWWILTSSSGFYSYLTYQWGTYGDVPLPGDYDYDGRTDIAVFRPWEGTWYVLTASYFTF
jgi:hypothetical protein